MVKKNKEITTLDEVVSIMLKAFDSNQEYMDKKFGYIDNKFEHMDKRFDKIEKIILDDHKERIEKLETKVQYLENILNLPIKK